MMEYKDKMQVMILHKKLWYEMARVDNYNKFRKRNGLWRLKETILRDIMHVDHEIKNDCFLCDYADQQTEDICDSYCEHCIIPGKNKNSSFYCEKAYPPYIRLLYIFSKPNNKLPFTKEECEEIRECCVKISKMFDDTIDETI